MSKISDSDFRKLLCGANKSGKTAGEFAQEVAVQLGLKPATIKQKYAEIRRLYNTHIETERTAGKEGDVKRLEQALSLLTLKDGRGRPAKSHTVESLTAFLEDIE